MKTREISSRANNRREERTIRAAVSAHWRLKLDAQRDLLQAVRQTNLPPIASLLYQAHQPNARLSGEPLLDRQASVPGSCGCNGG
jgi:hypothetical protein